MAITAHKTTRVTIHRDEGRKFKVNVILSLAIFHGAIVFRDAAGNATNIIDTGNNPCIGIATDNGYDNSAVAAVTTDRPLAVEVGIHEEFATITGASISGGSTDSLGELVYATDNSSLTLTSTSNSKVGYIAGLNKAGDKFIVAIEPQEAS